MLRPNKPSRARHYAISIMLLLAIVHIRRAGTWTSSLRSHARWLVNRPPHPGARTGQPRWLANPKPEERKLVGLSRFELLTPRLSSVCSNQLSYRPKSVKERVLADGPWLRS